MTTIFNLPAAGQSAVMVILFIVLCFQLSACCAGFLYRVRLKHCMILSFMAFLSLFILSFLVAGCAMQAEKLPVWDITLKIMDIPAVFMLIYIFFTVVYSYWIMQFQMKYRKTAVTRVSVREGADLMPMGLCFFRKSGQPVLVNIQMDKLCNILCGETLQNGEVFWHTVSAADLGAGARRSSVLETPAIIFPDDSVWIFDRQIIKLGEEEIIQVTATDATELYVLTKRLREENLLLLSMKERLEDYRSKVDELTRTRQRLAMKIHIHDSIGQNLMLTRYYLTQNVQEAAESSLESVLHKWQNTISMIRCEEQSDESSGAFNYLINAADSAGVEVILDGELPEDERIVELITAAGAEALTNAVRHAGAGRLTVKVSAADLVYSVIFLNDGRPPEKPVYEGGGLAGLRRRVEDEGGTMTVSADPEFSLAVTIPEKGRVNMI